MYNQTNDVPVCDQVATPKISEMLESLNKVTTENLSLAKSIRSNLYGDEVSEGAPEFKNTCAAECIDNTLWKAVSLNSILKQIYDRL